MFRYAAGPGSRLRRLSLSCTEDHKVPRKNGCRRPPRPCRKAGSRTHFSGPGQADACLLLASGRNDSVNTAAEESSDGSARRIRRLKGAPLRAGESSITTAPVRLCGAPPHFLPSRKAPPLPAKAPRSPAPRAPFLGWAFPGGVASGSPPAVGRRGRGRLVAGCAAVLARFAAGAPSRHRNLGAEDIGAEDGIRTRDPHLGKVMRYRCATSALEHHFIASAHVGSEWHPA